MGVLPQRATLYKCNMCESMPVASAMTHIGAEQYVGIMCKYTNQYTLKITK